MKNVNKIQQFHSEEFGSLEVLTIGGKPYFPATECARVLGYANPHKAVIDHCKKNGLTNREVIDRLGRTQERKYISEGNLYRLIIRSKLPEAERFESWVFDEVLPTVRKHGAYATNGTLDELARSPMFSEALIRKLEEERQKYDTLDALATELAPKAIYCDLVLQAKNAVPVSLIAKDYGMSASAFNQMLCVFDIQYKTGGTWILYQKYSGKGYTKTRTYYLSETKTVMHTCWTQKGRLFLYSFLKPFGILPLMETDYDDCLPESHCSGSFY